MARAKSPERGKPAVMKLRDDEEEAIIEWISAQSNYSDSLRYLIQKEIAMNGIQNLQLQIPTVRSIETLRSSMNIREANLQTENINSNILVKRPVSLTHQEVASSEHVTVVPQEQHTMSSPIQNEKVENGVLNNSIEHESEVFIPPVVDTEPEMKDVPVVESVPTPSTVIADTPKSENKSSSLLGTGTTTKRPAKKSFDPSVISSYQ
ncbi:hypothetical protein [Paenibacillus sp. FSL K6-2862]|uniref:hypothetical protein n=1 Tax=Paenibacillus sp. FSL K6-2862 TaxID=2921484 RepID=UPI0030F4C6DC